MESTVKLKHGDWYAEILPHFGMNAVVLRHCGNDILRSPRDIDELRNSPYLFGTPFLFPANRTKGGRFGFSGKEYSLPLNEPTRSNHIHGLMYDAPFEVVERTSDSLVAKYVNRGERYPFSFTVIMADRLAENGYTRTVRITNDGKAAFPFTMAFHTTFLEPKRFSAPIGRRYEVDENYIPTGKAFDTVEEYREGVSPFGKKISGFFMRDGEAALVGNYVYRFSDGFDNVILFNALGEMRLLCIEPQAGAVNGLNSGKCKTIEPNEADVYWHSIGI